MYIILGQGRKSGVARATEATASLAPLQINQQSMMHFENCPKPEENQGFWELEPKKWYQTQLLLSKPITMQARLSL